MLEFQSHQLERIFGGRNSNTYHHSSSQGHNSIPARQLDDLILRPSDPRYRQRLLGQDLLDILCSGHGPIFYIAPGVWSFERNVGEHDRLSIPHSNVV